MTDARGKQPVGAGNRAREECVRRGWLVSACFAALFACAGAARAADRLRIAAQKTGTLAWELDVIRARGLAAEAGLDLAVTELAAPEAGKIALESGSADVILADLMWVSRERSLGGRLLFAPYSSTLGAVMAPGQSPIRGIEDLKGRSLGVAGGPLDKSWLMLRALARRAGLDLPKQARIAYGAPKLLAVKAEQGELESVLNYWNFCADLETLGFRRAIDMRDVERALGASGPVAMVGYAFSEDFARASGSALSRFLGVSARARYILVNTPGEWSRLAPRIGVASPDGLAIYRSRYAEGATPRPLDEEERDARALYGVIAGIGGAELVGPALELDPGTYWRPPAGALR